MSPSEDKTGDMTLRHVMERAAAAEQRAERLRAMAVAVIEAEQQQRRRLAKLLHDGLQQTLYVVRLTLDRCRRHGDDEKLGHLLHHADVLLEQAMTESRSLTIELSPPVLYDSGLPAALQWLSGQMRQRHDLGVSVLADPGVEPMDEQIRVFLFFAAHELLLNVAQHAKVDEATLTVAEADPENIRMIVSDHGVGCDAAAVASGGSETCFGLFGIRERLELLGGEMDFHAATGQGTEVTMVVPRRTGVGPVVTAAEQAEAPSAARERYLTEPPASTDHKALRRIRVALADDHEILRQGLANLLVEEADIELVGEANDGREAVELALRTRPDVFLMDVTMPKLDGIEATRQIKAQLPETQIIGLSMHDEEGTAQAMRRAGAVAYLSKGTAFDLLVGAIRKHVNVRP